MPLFHVKQEQVIQLEWYRVEADTAEEALELTQYMSPDEDGEIVDHQNKTAHECDSQGLVLDCKDEDWTDPY